MQRFIQWRPLTAGCRCTRQRIAVNPEQWTHCRDVCAPQTCVYERLA
jgi:hypothetical protein